MHSMLPIKEGHSMLLIVKSTNNIKYYQSQFQNFQIKSKLRRYLQVIFPGFYEATKAFASSHESSERRQSSNRKEAAG